MKIKLFIDFDNTIFDTRKFKRPLFGVFKSLGFSEAVINKTYKEACEDYIYSPLEHLTLLKKIKNFNIKVASAELQKIYKETPSYLFEDSVDFLSNINREKFEVILLTLGDPDFQEKKVASAGISKYFDRTYYCKEQKWIYLKKLIDPDETFYLIDDRGDALYEVSKLFSSSKTIEISRAEKPLDDMEKPAPYRGIRIKNLNEAVPYLEAA